jgi:hypothetical protein
MAIYTSQTISGYNSSPPPDDGSQTGANRTTWSGVKTKLSDPVKTLAEAINTELVALSGRYIASDFVTKAATFAVATSDNGKVFLCGTGSYTVDLPAAASAGEGFLVCIINSGSGTTITIDGNASETINGSTTYALRGEYEGVWLSTDATSWYIVAQLAPRATTAETLTGTERGKWIAPDSVAALYRKGDTATATGTVTFGDGGYFVLDSASTVGTIAATSSRQGRRIMIRFNATITLTHNASAIALPGSQNITFRQGDIGEFIDDGSGVWRMCRFIGNEGRPWARIYESGEQAVSNNTLLSLEHGFGMIPKVVNARLRLTGATGDLSYSQNTEVIVANGMTASGNGVSVLTTATAVLISQAGTNLFLHTATGGNAAQITNAQWRWVVTAYA